MPKTAQAVTFSRVTIDDRFWSARIKANREQTIPRNYRQCKETGRIDALKLEWKPGQPHQPHIFWESDVAKFIEAASYHLQSHPDADLEAKVDGVIALLAAAQQPDGYLNAYYTVVKPGERWTQLRDNHELYCAGHLIEAGVAHFEATGKRSLLNVVRRYADCIDATFGTSDGKKRGYCGHPEIELALVRLFRVTGERKYLELSRYFIDERGQQPHYFDTEARARGDDPKHCPIPYEYNQSKIPLRELNEIAGHAVRGMYVYSAMADLAAEDDDQALRAACERLWKHGTTKLMYLTGGLGSSRHNEGYTFDYDLPNETAYCETCAAIAFVYFAQRMLHLTGDARYADTMERALYNAVLSGVSLDGAKFFYENPLASVGKHHRQDWFHCACCPPNIARLLASLGGYIYSESERAITIDLFIQSRATLQLSGQSITVRQETDYPWDGAVRVRIESAAAIEFELKLRRPEWAREFSVTVNGERVNTEPRHGYISINRTWSAGDTVELHMGMPVERVYANPRVRMNCGRTALLRGPLVYCLEGVDNGADLNAIELPREATFETQSEPGLMGGMVTIRAQARRISNGDWDGLYRTAPPRTTDIEVKAIPYFAWDNREPGEMLVWLRDA